MYIKQRLENDQTLLGAVMFSGSPDAIEFSTRSLDWLWLEGQHTHADWQTLIHGVRAANGIGVAPFVRTWTHDGGTIERLLDTGAEGIIVPMIDTPQQAEQIAARCYYPPAGKRSFGSIRTRSPDGNVAEWNNRLVTVMQIETPQAVENAQAIANIPGVDVLHLGLADLALRTGKTRDSQTVHVELKNEIDHVVEACRKAGKTAAVIVETEQDLVQCIRTGYRLIAVGPELNLLATLYQQMRNTFNQALARSS